MASIGNLPRPQMKRIGREVLTLLQARPPQEDPEKPLDDLMAELETVVLALESGVGGQSDAAATLKAILAKLEAADSEVDTWLRHHYYFVHAEAIRRVGPNVAAAIALQAAAFPDGLEHVDDYIPDENNLCRETIALLRHPDHAPAVAAIGLPTAWTDAWEAAVDASDAAFKQARAARGNKSIHVLSGQDAEVAFVDVMTRLKNYIGLRAPRTNKVKLAQGKALIEPLLTELTKMRAEEKARETLKKAQKDKGPPTTTPGATGATGPVGPSAATPATPAKPAPGAPATPAPTTPTGPTGPSATTPATPATPAPAPADGGK